MSVGSVLGKVAVAIVAGFAVGYAGYRLQGGEPICRIYKEVKRERLNAEAAAKRHYRKPIVADGVVK